MKEKEFDHTVCEIIEIVMQNTEGKKVDFENIKSKLRDLFEEMGVKIEEE